MSHSLHKSESPSSHGAEVSSGERFTFGENWANFLRTVDEYRIGAARESLLRLLDRADLHGRTFLDIGSGSGLLSLAARQLGAVVRSMDYDPQSVACAISLRDRYRCGDQEWEIGEGSVLDTEFMRGLGQFDVVYAWGVLHHTGDMWSAIDNSLKVVVPGGIFVVALYNDEGRRSHAWRWIKRTYNRLPWLVRPIFGSVVGIAWEVRMLLAALATGRPLQYFRSWRDYRDTSGRGMSRWHDLIDWIGGYPFEVTTPDRMLDFCRPRGFDLIRLVTTRGLGCNEFVFQRRATVS